MTEPNEPFNPSFARMVNRNNKEPAYRRAPKQEKDTRKRLNGGRAIPASGAKFRKGDVEVPNIVRIECKATRHKSFSITQEMISKIENACLATNQLPMIEVEFVDKNEKTIYSVCVLKRTDVTNLINRVTEAEYEDTNESSIKRPKRNSGWGTKNKR